MLQRLKTRALASLATTKDRVRRALGIKRRPESPLDLANLEERILLSASPAAAIDVEAMVDAESSLHESPAEVSQLSTSNGIEGTAVDAGVLTGDSTEFVRHDTGHLLEDSNSVDAINPGDREAGLEIVIVDSGAVNFQQLVDDLESQKESGRNIDILVLDSDSDGVDQITEALQEYSQLDAIHLVSHGTDGAIKLGSTWLQLDSLDGVSGQIAQWGSALDLDGDLLIYGCNLAETLEGQMLTEAISGLTGADVAASTDDTGAAILGGDWELEFQRGEIETPVVFSTELQQSWHGLLNTFVVTTVNDAGPGSLRQAILDANSNAGLDDIHFNIAGTGPHTIQLASKLPQITDAVSIDGSTEPDFVGSPVIVLDGNNAGGENGIELSGASNGSTIKSLSLINFEKSGIEITSDSNTIQGNYIGTDPAGNSGLGNQAWGIQLRASANNNLIGGAVTGEGNVISGNTQGGINLSGAGTSGTTIYGNLIGTSPSGFLPLGNSGNGILVENNASDNFIGGIGIGQANVIAFNGGNGIEIMGSGTDRVTIRGNSIHSNGGLGLDLKGDNVSANDPDDEDNDSNQLQNFPVLASVMAMGANLSVSGTLNSVENAMFDIDVYASSVGDGSGHGEAERYFGSTTVSTNGNGDGTFNVTLNSANVLPGEFVTATATDQAGNTSEFSLNVTAISPPATLVTTGETLVNTTTTDVQETASNRRGSQQAIASDAIGNYVVVWSSNNQIGQGYEVYAQRYNAGGVAQGGEIRVNEFTTGDQKWASVAMAGDGTFVVTWTSVGQQAETSSIYARRFNADGTAASSEFKVNSSSTGTHETPMIAMDATGNFAVVWGAVDGTELVYGQRFDRNGVPQGTQFTVDSGGLSGPDPTIAMASDGRFVVAWEHFGDIKAQRYDSSGVAQGAIITVDGGLTTTSDRPAVAIADDGSFVVLWSDRPLFSSFDVDGQRYDANGNTVGGQFTVNSTSSNDQIAPSVSMNGEGDFIVVWEGNGSGDGSGVLARKYDSAGVAVSNEFLVNSTTSGDQVDASVVFHDQDNFAITWSGPGSGDSDGVFVRQYGSADTSIGETTAPVIPDGTIEPTWNGVSTHDVNLLSLGAVDDANDLSATWRALYDSTHLYVLVEVTDNVLINDSTNSWEDDTVELFIDPDFSHGTSYDNVNDTLYLFRVMDGTVFVGSNSQGNTTNVQHQTVTTGNGYVTEIAIPWSTLDSNFTPSADSVIGIEIQVNDDDDGGTRDGKLEWNDGANSAFQDPSLFGAALLLQSESTTNQPPTLMAGGPYVIGEGGTVNLAATANDPEMDPLMFAWDLNNNGTFGEPGEPVSGSASPDWLTLQSFGIDDDGTYPIAVQVTDGTSTVTANTTIQVTNAAPSLSVMIPAIVVENDTFTINFSASDAGDDTISSWTVDWGDGTSTTLAGTASSATHSYPTIGSIHGITVSAVDEDGAYLGGDVIVSSLLTNSLFRFDGVTGNSLGQFANGNGLSNPIDVELTPEYELLASGFVSDDVQRFNATTGNFIDQFVSPGAGSLNEPARMTYGPDGNLYVSSHFNNQILRYNGQTGAFMNAFVSGAGGLQDPDGLTFGPDGFLYVANAGTGEITRHDPNNGANLGVFATVPASSGNFDLQFGPDDNLYVSSTALGNIRKFNGTTGAFQGIHVPNGSGGLSQPAGFRFNADGRLYVVDFGNNNVLRFDSTSGAFLDSFVDSGVGLNLPIDLNFVPDQLVSVVEFDDRVNEDRVDERQNADVASDKDGNYVVVWQATGQDGDLAGIYARRYDSAGNPLSSEFLVNSTTTNAQINPDIDMDFDGNFVISWTSLGQDGDTAGDGNIYARRYDSNGVALGAEFRVNSDMTGNQFRSSVAVGEFQSGFLVTWASDKGTADGVDVYGRLYDSNGVAQGAEFIISETTAGTETNPSATASAFGDYFVAWSSTTFEGNSTQGIVGRYIQQDGSFLTSEFGINSTTGGSQFDPSAAANAHGDVVVSWTSSDAEGNGIFATVVNYPLTQPVSVGTEIQINETTANDQVESAVSVDRNGNPIFTWASEAEDGDAVGEFNVYARYYLNQSGVLVPADAQFKVNPITMGNQQRVAVVADFAGDVVVAWDGEGVSDVDGIFHEQLLNQLGDDGPQVSVNSTPLVYVENDGEIQVDVAVALTAGVSTTLDRASVVIRTGFQSGEDELRFVDQNGITASWDSSTGVLNLTGTTTVANYQTALRSVTYINNSESPNTEDQLIEIFVDDGTYVSGDARVIQVQSVDDPITADAGGPYNFNEGTIQLLMGNGTDLDNAITTYEWDLSYDGVTFMAEEISQNVNFLAIDGPESSTTVALRVTNDNGITSPIVTQTVTVNNLDPVANDDNGPSYTTDEDSSFEVPNVLANDSDVLSDPLNISSLFQPAKGTTSRLGNTITFNPNGDFDTLASGQSEDVTFDYGVTDGIASDLGTVTVTVTGENDAPTFASTPDGNVDENSSIGTVVTTIAGSDVDSGDTVQYSITAGDPNSVFAVTSTTGVITVNDPTLLDFESTQSFSLTVTIQDQAGATDTETILVSVNDVNEVPVIDTTPVAIQEHLPQGQVVLSSFVFDPETAGLTGALGYTILSGNLGGAFEIIPGTDDLTVADSNAVDYETTTQFNLEIQVTDGTHVVTDTLVIGLIEINEPPVVDDLTLDIDEDASNGVLTTLIASEPEMESVTWSLGAGAPTNIFSLSSSGVLSILDSTPLNFEVTPSYSIPVVATDSRGLAGSATVTVNLNDVAEPPIVTGAFSTIPESITNGSSVGMISAFDEDAGDVLTHAIAGGDPDGAFTINPATGLITVADTTQIDFETTPGYIVSVDVSDGLFTVQGTINITVTDSNEPPTIDDDTFSISEITTNSASVGVVTASDQDANTTLSYSINAGNTSNAFLITGLGEIVVNDANLIDFETTPNYSLTVEVSDGVFTDTATIQVNVLDENEPPELGDATFSLDEKSTNETPVVTMTATDPDAGVTLNYSISSGNTGNAFAINLLSGEITVADENAVDFETTASYSLTIEVTDGTLSDSATVAININDVNESPNASDSTFSVSEFASNSTEVGTVVASDPDAGTVLDYSISAGNTDNIFAINSTTGAITVEDNTLLNHESVSGYLLTVDVTDGSLTDQATITINVSDENEAPQLGDETFPLSEFTSDNQIVGQVTGTDPDNGATLSYTVLSGNVGSAFSLNPASGQITVADSTAINFETFTTYLLTVQVSDGTLTDNANVQIPLIDEPEPPTISDDAFTLSELTSNGAVVGQVTASDPDSNTTLSYSILSGNTGNALTIDSGGEITVADANQIDFETLQSYSLVVEVSDGGLTDMAAIQVDIQDVNESPILTGGPFSLSEFAANGTIVGNMIGNDPESAPLIYSIVNGNTAEAFAINSSNGQITVADETAINFESDSLYTLHVEVTDGFTGAATITQVMILDENEAPTVSDDTFSIDENLTDGTVVGTVAASDPDTNSALVYSITGGNLGNAFAISPSTGEITVPNANSIDFETTPSYSLTVEVTDGALADSATITVDVNDVNEAPIINEATFQISEFATNGSSVGTVAGTDEDQGTLLVHSITNGDPNDAFRVDPTSGLITINDQNEIDFENTPSYTLTVEVSDGSLSDSATVTINISDENESPSLADETFSASELVSDSFSVATLTAVDPDSGTILGYSILSGNTGNAFQLNANAGELTIPSASAIDFETTPSYTLQVQVSDGTLIDTASITVSINDENETPSIANNSFAISELALEDDLVGTTLGTDPDAGAALVHSILSGNVDGAFKIDPTTGAILVNDPNSLNFEAVSDYTLTIQVSDGTLSDSASVAISVIDQNEAPTISGETFSLSELVPDNFVVGTVSASDPDAGTTLLYSIDAGNTGNVFNISPTGQIVVPDASLLDFETTPSFTLTVRVSDGLLDDSATVQINLTDQNEAPSVGGSTFSVSELSETGARVGFATGTDPDQGTSLIHSITTGNLGSAFAIDSTTGEITINDATAIDFESNPSFALTVEVTDGLLMDSATITVNVTDENEPPSLADGMFNVSEFTTDGFSVGMLTATDPDTSSNLVYSIASGNTGTAFAVDSTTGEITIPVASAINFEAIPSYSLSVEVSDGQLVDSATIVIDIDDENESPTIVDAAFNFSEFELNGFVVGQVLGSDPDQNQTLIHSITSGNTGGAFAIDSMTGQLTIANQSATDFETNPNFSLVVQTSDGMLSDTASVMVSLIDENEPPTIDDATYNLSEFTTDGAILGQPNFHDPDANQNLTFSIVSGNTGEIFAIDPSRGELSVLAASGIDFETQSQFTLTVQLTDGQLSDSAVVTVNIIDENEPPVITDANFTLSESSSDGAFVGRVQGIDGDQNDNVTHSIIAGNTGGAFAIDSTTGDITVANENAIDFESAPSFELTVEASDENLTDTASVQIDLTDENEAPVALDANFSISEFTTNGTVLGTVSASDHDAGAVLNYSITGGNTNGAFAIDGSGQLTVADASVIDHESQASYSLIVEVTDGSLADLATVTVTINDVNEQPTAGPLPDINVNEDSGQIIIDLFDTFDDVEDNDGQLTYQTNISNGGLVSSTINGRNLRLNLASDANGTSTIDVVAIDTGGLVASTSFMLTVDPVNDAPSTAGDFYSLGGGNSISIDENSGVLANDVDAEGDSITVSLVSPPTFGAVTLNSDGSFEYTVNAGVIGTDTFTYVASDGTATSQPTTVRISVVTAFIPPPPPLSPTPEPPPEPKPDLDFTPEAPAEQTPAVDSGDDLSATNPESAPEAAPEAPAETPQESPTETAPETPTDRPTDSLADTTGDSNSPEVDSNPTAANPNGDPSTPVDAPAAPADPTGGDSTPNVEDSESTGGTESVPNGDESSSGASETSSTTTNNSPTTIAGIGSDSTSGRSGSETATIPLSAELKDITRSVNFEVLAFSGSNSEENTAFDFATALNFGDEDLSFVGETEFLEELDENQTAMDEVTEIPEIVVESAVVTTASLSVGYIVWMLRSGYVLASVLSTMPVWKNIDPLPVLDSLDRDEEDDESLESMIEDVEGQEGSAEELDSDNKQATADSLNQE